MAGLRHFNLTRAVEVIIIARGGGSAEDLAAFNHEGLARAVAASEIPVISAIGHETDFTIVDFVADLRAPTPSAAAELVIRSRQEIETAAQEMHRRLERAMRYRLLMARQQLTAARAARRLCPHAGGHQPPSAETRRSALPAGKGAAPACRTLLPPLGDCRGRGAPL